MRQAIDVLKDNFHKEVQEVHSTAGIESLRVKYLGKKGPIQDLMKQLKEVSLEERPLFGKIINDLKEEISATLEKEHHEFLDREESLRILEEKIDITLPGRAKSIGRKHIVQHVLDRMIDIMMGMGFSVQYGPDVDSDYYNFEALNFAPDHPARDMQDTFYIAQNVLLRTHTSNIQIRVMESQKPPIRIIAPGKAYRSETITARSHVFFHQIEAMYIDRGVSFADLLATLKDFLSKLFKTEVQTRFRPSYFPFVEPGMEVDIRCLSCSGRGCSICKQTGWLEVAGAGMVHPEVLKNGDIDPEEYSGYAWGVGVERLVMLMHGVNDIRLFTENDLRFLEQFTA